MMRIQMDTVSADVLQARTQRDKLTHELQNAKMELEQSMREIRRLHDQVRRHTHRDRDREESFESVAPVAEVFLRVSHLVLTHVCVWWG